MPEQTPNSRYRRGSRQGALYMRLGGPATHGGGPRSDVAPSAKPPALGHEHHDQLLPELLVVHARRVTASLAYAYVSAGLAPASLA